MTKYKCFIIQKEQNTTPKYKHDKMQKFQNTNMTKYKRTKYKCKKIQMQQNHLEHNTKISKYKHNKIQKDKILVFQEPPYSRPPPLTH